MYKKLLCCVVILANVGLVGVVQAEVAQMSSENKQSSHDSMVECTKCKHRMRADQMDINKPCPKCGNKGWTHVPAYDKKTGLNFDEILFVNMQDAMLISAQGKDAQILVEAEEKKYAELAQKEQQRMMQLKNEIDTKSSMLNVDTRRKMEKELNDLQRDFQNKVQDWKYELQYTMQKETDTMIKEIEQAAKVLAQTSGKAAVIDAPTGRILYLRDDKNSTNDLVALLDTQHTIRLAQNDKQPQNTVVAAKDADKKSARA